MSSHIKDIKQAGGIAGQKLILRWFDSSGGKQLKASTTVSYEEYLCRAKEPEALDSLTLEQIHKDVTRANFNSFHIPSLRTFLMGVGPKEETEPVLVNILMAYCERNPYPGYAQGMDQITIMLMGLAVGLENAHSLVFWVLCGLVENLRLPDFYSPPPTGMAGFVFERRLLCSLVRGRFSSLIQSAGGLQPVLDILEALCPRWLISMYLDVVELETQILIWDFFFSCGGDLALILLTLAVFSYLASNFDCVNGDLFVDFSTQIELLSPPHLMQHLDSINYFLVPSDVLFSEKLKHDSRSDFQLFRLLDTCLQIHTPQYKLYYQAAYRGFYLQSEEGISISQFAHVIEQINLLFPLPEEALPRLWETLSPTKKVGEEARASWKNVIYCLSTLCGDTLNDKLHLFYHMFDLEKTGRLGESQVLNLSSVLLKACSQPQKPLQGIPRELSLLFERWEELSTTPDGFTFSDFRQFVTERAPLILQVFKLPVELHPRLLGFPPPCKPGEPPPPSIRRFATVGMGFKRHPEPAGLIVTKITADGAAIKAGLDSGDVMCAVNGIPVETREEFFVLYPLLLPGEIRTLNLSILRPATVAQRRTLGNLGTKAKPVYAPMDVSLVLECNPLICTEIESNKAKNIFFTMKKEMGLTFNYPSGKESDSRNEGLYVTEVDNDLAAHKCGLQVKDIITHMDGTRLLDSTCFLRAYNRVKPGDKISFIIRRPKMGSPVHTVIFHPPSPKSSTSQPQQLNAAFYSAPPAIENPPSPSSTTNNTDNSNNNTTHNHSPTHQGSPTKSSPLKNSNKLLSRGAHILNQVQDTAVTLWNQELPLFDDSHYPPQVVGYDTLMALAIVGGHGMTGPEIEDLRTKAFAPILPADAIKTPAFFTPPASLSASSSAPCSSSSSSSSSFAALHANVAASAATAAASLAVAAATATWSSLMANSSSSRSSSSSGGSSKGGSGGNSNVGNVRLVPMVGMTFVPHVEEHTHGLYVSHVVVGQPAALAGVREGDFITHLDAVPVPLRPAVSYIASRQIGDSITFTLQRSLSHLSLDSPRDQPELAITLESPTSALASSSSSPPSSSSSPTSSIRFGFSSSSPSSPTLSALECKNPSPPLSPISSAPSSPCSSSSFSSSFVTLVLPVKVEGQPETPPEEDSRASLSIGLPSSRPPSRPPSRPNSRSSRPSSRRNSYSQGSMTFTTQRGSKDLGTVRTGSESPRSQTGESSSSSGSSSSSSAKKPSVKKYVMKRRHSAPPVLNFEITPKAVVSSPASSLSPPAMFRRWSTSFLGGAVSPVPLLLSVISPDRGSSIGSPPTPISPPTPRFSLASWPSFASLSPASKTGNASPIPSSSSSSNAPPDLRKTTPLSVFGKARAKAAYEAGKMKLNPQIERAQRDQIELKRKLGLTMFELFATDQLASARSAFEETKLQIDAIESTLIAVKRAELALLRCASMDVGEVSDAPRSSASFSFPPSSPNSTSNPLLQ